MVEKGLYTVLTTPATIAGARIYPRLPQNVAFPAVRYQQIGSTRIHSIEGDNVGPTEFTMQIDCMGNTYADAKNLAAAVFGRLHGYRGAWGSSICRFCTLQTDNDFYEQDGDDITHWVSQRYLVWTNDA
jgi:hypothetical protein